MSEPFDAVAWMRKRRGEIDEEDQGLSWEEKHLVFSGNILRLLEGVKKSAIKAWSSA